MKVDPFKVQGCCPMGCGETLFLGDGGYVTCSLLGCPNPTAVSDILAERETEHIVKFEPDTFSVIHPLRERLHGELLECLLHQHIANLDGPPVAPGRYRAREAPADSPKSWTWQRLAERSTDEH